MSDNIQAPAIILRVVAPQGDWFAIVDPHTGAKTVQQGIHKDTQGAVGPYATKREAEQWSGVK